VHIRALLVSGLVVASICAAGGEARAQTFSLADLEMALAAAPAPTNSMMALAAPASPASVLEAGPLSRPVASAALPVRLTPSEADRFLGEQLSQPRVRQARQNAGAEVRRLFEEAGVAFPSDVYFRVFKRERLFQAWALDAASGRWVRLAEWPVCALSGELGPKRVEGDGQIPEGLYEIDLFNPLSAYHLSLRVDYPNAVDLALGRAERLGGDIFVHGGCETIGCVPMTDEVIEQVYWLAVEARASGQRAIPIHIFPSRMDDVLMNELWRQVEGDWSTWRFWLSLKAAYDHFEVERALPAAQPDQRGFYRIGA